MRTEKCCCCHIVTGAAIVGMIQLIVIVCCMAIAGTVLDRWETWYEWYEEGEMQRDVEKWKSDMKAEMEAVKSRTPDDVRPAVERMDKVMNSMLHTNYTISREREEDLLDEDLLYSMDHFQKEGWKAVLMEIQLACEIAFASVWLLALFVYAAAFRYWKPAFVLPNLVMQVLVVILTILGIINMAGSLGAAREEADADTRAQRTVIAALGLVLFILMFIVELVFLVIINKFYKHLRNLAGLVFPGLPPLALPDKVLDDALA